MILVSRNIKYADIREGCSRRGSQTTVGLSTTTIFAISVAILLRNIIWRYAIPCRLVIDSVMLVLVLVPRTP